MKLILNYELMLIKNCLAEKGCVVGMFLKYCSYHPICWCQINTSIFLIEEPLVEAARKTQKFVFLMGSLIFIMWFHLSKTQILHFNEKPQLR